MGRFETWIDRVTNARRRRSGDAGSVRRRPLRFEQFESRLTLSAAVQDQFVAGDSLLTSGPVLQSLWEATPGSAQWGDVTFSAPIDSAAFENATWLSFRSAQSDPRSMTIEHGGLIGLDSMSNMTSMLTQRAAFAFHGGVSRGEFQLDDYILSTDSLAGADGTSSIVIGATPSGFDPSWSSGINPPLGGSSLYPGGGDGLNSAGAGGDAPGTGEANVTLIESPVLRITAPLPDANDEGGSIDVTAMVAPRGLFAAQHATALATNGVRTGTSASTTETPLRGARTAAADADELRARAVVYEVSLARDASDETLDATRAEQTPAVPAPSAPMTVPSAGKAPTPAVTAEAKGEIAAWQAAPRASEDASTASHQAAGADSSVARSTTRAAARDAALARFGDEAIGGPAADLETASSRNQTLGMALAAVVGAGPLVRRMRRSRAARAAEQAAGLA